MGRGGYLFQIPTSQIQIIIVAKSLLVTFFLGFSWLPLVVLLGAAAGQEVSRGGATLEPKPPLSSGGPPMEPQPPLSSGGATVEPKPSMTRPCYCLGDQSYPGYVCPLGDCMGTW